MSSFSEVWVAESLVEEILQVGVLLREERQKGNPHSPHPSAKASLSAGDEGNPEGSSLAPVGVCCLH